MKRKMNEKKWMITKLLAELAGIIIMLAGIFVFLYSFSMQEMILYGGPHFCLGIFLSIAGIFILMEAWNWKFKGSIFDKESGKAR